jgi:dihydroorotate dehydrogenase (NAD+) catalytic subunit
MPDPFLATSIAGLALPSPVLLAAGTAGTLDELADALDLAALGGLVTKSLTPLPRDGNPHRRILPTDAGMLNAIGLANVGIAAFVRDYAPRLASVPTAVIASVAGFSIDDYVLVASRLAPLQSLQAIELNVSCPNVKHGTEFGSDPASLADLVREVRRVLPIHRLFVKLSPIACGPVALAHIARAAIEPLDSPPAGPNQRPGADALCVANTIPAMAIDPHTRRPRLANVTGGLSGPALHPVAVKLVYDLSHALARPTGTPIIGIGGVLTWEHAAEFILAGASAVQIGTGLFADPRTPARVTRGLAHWVRAQRATSIADLVGAVALG